MEEFDERKPTNYTGLIIGVVLLPVYLFFWYIGKPDMGLTAFLCLGVNVFAIGFCWDLRGRFWFWLVIILILALHVPLILKIQWPKEWVPAVALLPIGLADLLIAVGLVRLVQKIIMRSTTVDEEA